MDPAGKEGLDFLCLFSANERLEISAVLVSRRTNTVAGTNEKKVENENWWTPTSVRLAFRPERGLGMPTK